MKRKLIEVALPLDAINEASHLETRNPFIRGHPKSLKWWARRPLAACRAVLFAQLVDDPSSHPEEFPTEETQDAERQRLFEIIGELVKWENSNNQEVLERARAEILKSTGGDPPPILDPFAGGGSIPLEAHRLGLEVYASDLNPVAVLINKALIEIPPKWAGQHPVHPDAEQRMSWSGTQGLAEDLRRYGHWIRDEAEKRIGHLYPKAKFDDGSEANVIAWIWARTVICPNPVCGAAMPLASTFWLSRRKGKETWINPIVEGKRIRFEIGYGPKGPPDPPKVGRGARFRCLVCGETVDEALLSTLLDGQVGPELMAVVAQRGGSKVFLDATSTDLPPDVSPSDQEFLQLEIPIDPRIWWFRDYGVRSHADLYTLRQTAVLNTLLDISVDVVQRVARDAEARGLDPSLYSADLLMLLAQAFGRMVMFCNSLCTWNVTNENVTNPFGMTAPSFAWDFVEANALASPVDFTAAVSKIAEVLEQVPANTSPALIRQADARESVWNRACIATDPPYYDNVTYSDMADVFYLWYRKLLHSDRLTATIETPKRQELVANPVRHRSPAAADKFFEVGLAEFFERAIAVQIAALPMTIFYAFKQAESGDSDGLGSTGWSTMLEGLLKAGWMVTATWPMRTEREARKRGQTSNALASSVVLACRPREVDAGITDRQGFLRVLGERLPTALHELQKASIAPVDLRQAAIGPGMAVFSQYEKVVEPDSTPMRVRTALGLINQVLDQVLDEQQAEFDRETRWAIQWFSQFFDDEGPYGTAETLAVSMDVSIEGLRDAGIVYSGGGKVRLLSRGELPDDWNPARDTRTPVWEAAQHLVKRLEDQGEAAAAVLLNQLGGLADSAQTLATILYTKAERTRPGLAGLYNGLVASWPTIQRLARQSPPPVQPQQPTLTES